MKTIVLTGGGTAGHVLPHFALLPHLRKHFERIYYIGSHDGVEKKLVENEKLEYFSVTCVKFRRSLSPRNIVRNLSIPFKLLKGIREAKKLLRKLRPDVVFSKGGFVAYPVVRAAAKLGIPVVTHESDMTMGLANRLSVKYCVKVCTTFKMKDERGKMKDKVIHTGSPIRERIYYGDKNIPRHAFGRATPLLEGGIDRNLLIIGGSSGAAKINAAVREVLPQLAKQYNLVHICGKGKTTRPEASAGVVQLEYVDDIENYLAWADIVVSRAGSNALCELMVLGKAVLFIPLSTGRGDQIDNAKEVLRHNAGAVLWEEFLTAKTLVDGIEAVWAHRKEFSRNTKSVVTDGTQKIVSVVCNTTPRAPAN